MSRAAPLFEADLIENENSGSESEAEKIQIGPVLPHTVRYYDCTQVNQEELQEYMDKQEQMVLLKIQTKKLREQKSPKMGRLQIVEEEDEPLATLQPESPSHREQPTYFRKSQKLKKPKQNTLKLKSE